MKYLLNIENIKIMDKICPIVTTGIILKERKNNDCILMHCFKNIEDHPSISSKLLYSPTSINKKEVACNDNTGTIKLTFWRSCIDFVKECVVYFIQAKVREQPKWILSITTTLSTSVIPSKEIEIKPKRTNAHNVWSHQ